VTLPEGTGGARGDGGGLRFLREERLRSDREYREVVRKGERASTAHFAIYRDFLGGEGRKVGISAGKKAGRAVVRNRIKRILREFYRIHKCAAFPPGSRTAIVVKRTPSRPGLASVSAELLPAISRRWGRKEGTSLCGQAIFSSAP
jgi:ribonuclease P protein component